MKGKPRRKFLEPPVDLKKFNLNFRNLEMNYSGTSPNGHLQQAEASPHPSPVADSS